MSHEANICACGIGLAIETSCAKSGAMVNMLLEKVNKIQVQ